jgi:hypothetical protein
LLVTATGGVLAIVAGRAVLATAGALGESAASNSNAFAASKISFCSAGSKLSNAARIFLEPRRTIDQL